MILILFIPAIAWAFSPTWFSPWMKVVAGLSLALATVLFFRRLRRGWQATSDNPARAAWHWQPRWNATEYRQHLMNHFEEGGWTVLASALPDADRVQITCERGRDRVVLLCLRPGAVTTQDDANRLAAEQATVEATTALLVRTPAEYAALEDPESIAVAPLL